MELMTAVVLAMVLACCLGAVQGTLCSTYPGGSFVLDPAANFTIQWSTDATTLHLGDAIFKAPPPILITASTSPHHLRDWMDWLRHCRGWWWDYERCGLSICSIYCYTDFVSKELTSSPAPCRRGCQHARTTTCHGSHTPLLTPPIFSV